jgi:hypothetical protein
MLPKNQCNIRVTPKADHEKNQGANRAKEWKTAKNMIAGQLNFRGLELLSLDG